jgi:hypothetical protein
MKNLELALQVGKAGFASALLPWTLPNDALMDDEYSRADRMSMIHKVFSCLLLSYVCLREYRAKKKRFTRAFPEIYRQQQNRSAF